MARSSRPLGGGEQIGEPFRVVDGALQLGRIARPVDVHSDRMLPRSCRPVTGRGIRRERIGTLPEPVRTSANTHEDASTRRV